VTPCIFQIENYVFVFGLILNRRGGGLWLRSWLVRQTCSAFEFAARGLAVGQRTGPFYPTV
jgi:hypothetical protein